MTSSDAQPNRKHRGLILVGSCILLTFVIGGYAWKTYKPVTATTGAPKSVNSEVIDPNTPPAEAFATLREVCLNGGDEYSQAAANSWLEVVSRDRLKFNSEQESFLITMLSEGGHSSWTSGYRQQLFNSACNVLLVGKKNDAYAGVLEQMATAHEDLTLRLYALQHIALMRHNGRLTGAVAGQMHDSVKKLASKSNEPVVGSAIWVLSTWNGVDQPLEPEILGLALGAAANSELTVDVRVTALNAATAQALPLARELSMDVNAPVLLRKTAIALVGLHGDASDLEHLERLRNEGFRLAQAAEPAIEELRLRLSGTERPSRAPF